LESAILVQATTYDVIVIGGGPAGAATAAHLAKAGHEVLLMDREVFPRDKPCGEFYSPPVRGLLSELGVYDEVLNAGAHSVPGAMVYTQNGQAFGSPLTNVAHPWASKGGFSLERRVLDNLLWKNAAQSGADTRQGVALRGLLRNEAGHICGVRTDAGEFRAPLVVGADGGRSRVAREMGMVRPLRHLQKIALVSHYSGVHEKKDAPPLPVEMHLGAEDAVCGYSPGPFGSANVTIVVPEREARAIAAVGTEAYADMLLATRFPKVAARLQRATRSRMRTCGTFGHWTKTPIADGVLLVGDAATFVDPFTGEGVYFALRGAEIAAETIHTALRSGDTSQHALRSYSRARQAELLPKYVVCGLVERAVHSPRLIQHVAPHFARRPDAMKRLLAVTGDMANPTTLFAPGFWWAALTA